jgi:hypothetical protein
MEKGEEEKVEEVVPMIIKKPKKVKKVKAEPFKIVKAAPDKPFVLIFK